jgi:hypothetical protein
MAVLSILCPELVARQAPERQSVANLLVSISCGKKSAKTSLFPIEIQTRFMIVSFPAPEEAIAICTAMSPPRAPEGTKSDVLQWPD